VVNVKASDFEVFEALAVDSIGTESAKTGDLLTLTQQLIESVVSIIVAGFFSAKKQWKDQAHLLRHLSDDGCQHDN